MKGRKSSTRSSRTAAKSRPRTSRFKFVIGARGYFPPPFQTVGSLAPGRDSAAAIPGGNHAAHHVELALEKFVVDKRGPQCCAHVSIAERDRSINALLQLIDRVAGRLGHDLSLDVAIIRLCGDVIKHHHASRSAARTAQPRFKAGDGKCFAAGS